MLRTLLVVSLSVFFVGLAPHPEPCFDSLRRDVQAYHDTTETMKDPLVWEYVDARAMVDWRMALRRKAAAAPDGGALLHATQAEFSTRAREFLAAPHVACQDALPISEYATVAVEEREWANGVASEWHRNLDDDQAALCSQRRALASEEMVVSRLHKQNYCPVNGKGSRACRTLSALMDAVKESAEALYQDERKFKDKWGNERLVALNCK